MRPYKLINYPYIRYSHPFIIEMAGPMSVSKLLGVTLSGVALLGGLGITLAIAADPAAIVSQEGRKFTPGDITVKKGDMVRFVNDDFYGHNVYSETEGASFDIGLQPPGESRDVVLEKLGIVDVHCRIHPRMRLKITVTE